MPAAVAIPSIISGAASIGSALIGSSAAKSAATTQSNNAKTVADLLAQAGIGARNTVGEGVANANNLVSSGTQWANAGITDATGGANRTLADIFAQEYQNLNPYLSAGSTGIQNLLQAIAPGGELASRFSAPTAAEAEATPGYQFVQSQGVKGIMNNAAARGLSGGTEKDLAQFNQGLAGTYYQQAYNNALTGFNTNRNASLQNIQQLLGLGEFGTGQFNSAAQNFGDRASANQMTSGLAQGSNLVNAADLQGNNVLRGSEYQGNNQTTIAEAVAQAMTGGANAQAAGTVGSANAWQNGLAGAANSASQAYTLNQILSRYGIGQGNGSTINGGMPAGYTQPSVAGMAPPMTATIPNAPYSLPDGQY